MINTAYIERLNATFRERLTPLARRCRALARHTLTLHEGMFVVGTVYNFCTPHESLSHHKRRRLPWRQGSQTIAGRCTNSVVACASLAGYRRSGVDVLHGHCGT